MAELILIRGLPGSGKSTLAKSMAGYLHVEADMYHVVNGEYCFDPARISDAHAWCQSVTINALRKGCSVVVSNTFTQAWEMAPYFDMGHPVRVVTCEGRWDNVHGVPASAIERMAARWEPLEMIDYIAMGG